MDCRSWFRGPAKVARNFGAAALEERMRLIRAAVLLATLAMCQPAEAKVWCEQATTKVLKHHDGSGKAQEIRLAAARNEYEGFQVVILADGEALTNVEVSLSDLDGPKGSVAASNATLYLEYYVFIEKPSACDIFFSPNCADYPEYDRVAGHYPDALIPFVDPYSADHPAVAVPFDVVKDDLQTVFIDVHVPADTGPGEYTGIVTVKAAGELLSELPVTLQVWDFDMPVKRSVATAYGFGAGHLGAYHGGPDGPDAEQLAKLVRNYEIEIHRHRMDFTTHYPGLKFEFDEVGNLLPIDFAAYDAYIGPRVDGAYYPDGAGLNRYNLGILRPGHGTMGLTEDQFAQAAAAVAEHLDDKGFLPHVYLYSLDEPWLLDHWRNGSYEKIQKGVELLGKYTDLWKGHVLITGPWQPALNDCGDIWCPVTPMYGDVLWPRGSWPGPDTYRELMSKGAELWFYVCNANFPSAMGYDIDSPVGYEPRLTKWGAWYEGATGFLYWRMTYWLKNDPWHVLANYEQFGELFARNGDGILIYPGDHDGTRGGKGSPEGVSMDGPVVSYRMKQIRDGLEDWELFIMAGELGAKEYARVQVGTAYSAFGKPLVEGFDYANPPWTLDEDVLLEARRNVALKVQFLLHPESYQDPEAPRRTDTADMTYDVIQQANPDLASTDGPAKDSQSADVAIADPTQPKAASSGCTAAPSPSGAWPLLVLLVLLAAASSSSWLRGRWLRGRRGR